MKNEIASEKCHETHHFCQKSCFERAYTTRKQRFLQKSKNVIYPVQLHQKHEKNAQKTQKHKKHVF